MSGSRDSYNALFAAIAPSLDPSSADGTFMRSLFSSRQLRKGERYQRSGEITTHGGFVVQGCLRTYTVGEDGAETILFFSMENSWVGDISSARTRRPTNFHVDAIEPVELLVITIADFDRLLDRFPEIARGYQLALERLNASRARRLALALKSTAEERYADFVERNPALLTRVSQRMLASYLGMTPETLSRLRNRHAR